MSIKRIADNKYVIDWRDGRGRRLRRTIRGSKKSAEAILAKIIKDKTDEIWFPEKRSSQILFKDLVAFYWKMHAAQLRSKDWGYKKAIILEKFGKLRMQDLTGNVLQSFYNDMRATGRTPATARRYITFIGAIINLGIKHQYYSGKNPCQAVNIEPEDNKRTRYLNKEEIALLLDKCREDVRPVVFCALYTGMRRGEILSLTWDNVDLQQDNITLLRTKSTKKREIPIVKELKQLFLSMNPKKSGPVFPISRDAFICSFKRTLAKLAIPDFHFHDIRHTFASHFMMSGGSITDLQQILGHSDLKLTQRYAHLSQEHLKKGMQIIQGVFGDFKREP